LDSFIFYMNWNHLLWVVFYLDLIVMVLKNFHLEVSTEGYNMIIAPFKYINFWTDTNLWSVNWILTTGIGCLLYNIII
jgi:hypothetical protein